MERVGRKRSAGKGSRSVDPVVRTYGVGEVERLTGVNRITLHVWDRSGFCRPSVAGGGKGTGNRRKYSFPDVVALRVIKGLRDAGVSVRALRKIDKFLKEKEGLENPFAERFFSVQGEDVVMLGKDEAVSVLKRPGQYALMLRLDLEAEARRLKETLSHHAA